MKILSFSDQCKIASTEALCRRYKALRQEEQTIQARLDTIRQELIQRGILPSEEEMLKIFEESKCKQKS